MKIDMWYGNDVKEADSVDVFWNDSDCTYSGNIYRDGKAIGDYTADDSIDIQEQFEGLFEWR